MGAPLDLQWVHEGQIAGKRREVIYRNLQNSFCVYSATVQVVYTKFLIRNNGLKMRIDGDPISYDNFNNIPNFAIERSGFTLTPVFNELDIAEWKITRGEKTLTLTRSLFDRIIESAIKSGKPFVPLIQKGDLQTKGEFKILLSQIDIGSLTISHLEKRTLQRAVAERFRQLFNKKINVVDQEPELELSSS